MLGRRIRIQVTLFVIMALLGVTYVSVHYVGLQRLVAHSGYTVKLDRADAGGIFTNAEVTYRGVTVGRVGGMRLTADGIQVDLNLTRKGIPADLKAAVADRSAIGEQYVDLRPNSDSGPFLKDGSVIQQKVTTLPPPVDQLLSSADKLAQSVPITSLQTVVDELDKAFENSGQNLQLLLDSSSEFFKSADANFPQTAELLDNSATVLATQQQSSSDIIAFSRSLALIGDQLKKSAGGAGVHRVVQRRRHQPVRAADEPVDHLAGVPRQHRRRTRAVRQAARGDQRRLVGDHAQGRECRAHSDVLQPAAVHVRVRRHHRTARYGCDDRTAAEHVGVVPGAAGDGCRRPWIAERTGRWRPRSTNVGAHTVHRRHRPTDDQY